MLLGRLSIEIVKGNVKFKILNFWLFLPFGMFAKGGNYTAWPWSWSVTWEWLIVESNGMKSRTLVTHIWGWPCSGVQGHLGAIWCPCVEMSCNSKWLVIGRNGHKFGTPPYLHIWYLWPCGVQCHLGVHLTCNPCIYFLVSFFVIFINMGQNHGSKHFKTHFLLQITVIKLLNFLLDGPHKRMFLKIEFFFSFPLTWYPLGVKISKRCSSYKLQPNVFKALLLLLLG